MVIKKNFIHTWPPLKPFKNFPQDWEPFKNSACVWIIDSSLTWQNFLLMLSSRRCQMQFVVKHATSDETNWKKQHFNILAPLNERNSKLHFARFLHLYWNCRKIQETLAWPKSQQIKVEKNGSSYWVIKSLSGELQEAGIALLLETNH